MEQILPPRSVDTQCDAPDPEHPPRLERRDALLRYMMNIVGRSSSMRTLRQRIARFAPTSATVVIQGETGTGKELVARALHALSPRATRPFVAANVAALSPSTLMSELFGHERGAFTGACLRHKGLFEQSHGGTLFLDEVGELDLDAQAALLRVLESREVRAVGAERTRTVDVRLVVATHRNLAHRVRDRLFREDLFYRLHLLVVEVPPLRARIGDVPDLARHVLTSLAAEVGERTLDESALTVLMDYAWPGNVRQLQNVLRRAAIADDAPTLTAEHVRDSLAFEQRGAHGRGEADHAKVLAALAAEDGNITRVAKKLGLARSTVRAHQRRARRAHDG